MENEMWSKDVHLSRRKKRNKNGKGGRTVETAATALFAFMGFASSFGGLSASRLASALPRFGNRCFRTGQRKPVIRTHLLSETGSDYMSLSLSDTIDATEIAPILIAMHYSLVLYRISR